MISNLQLPNSEEFDVDTTLTLTRRQTKETLALLSAYPERDHPKLCVNLRCGVE